MMTPRDRVITEVSRAQGVMMTMYALIRDMGIANMVEEGKTGELESVVGATLKGIQKVVDLWDGSPDAEDENETD